MTETAGDTPRYYRARDGRVLAGVAAGLAEHLGIPALVPRLAFAALGFSGIGIVIYAVLLYFVPVRPQDAPPTEEGGEPRPRRDRRQLLGYLALAGVVGALLLLLSGLTLDPVLWFLVFGALGAAMLWRQANPTLRDELVAAKPLHSKRGWLRTGIGVLLILIGVIGFLVFQDQLAEARTGLTFALTLIVGIALTAAPWIVVLVRERDRERRERIRNQERAELAAHIHDSVLHTLTLIQRRSDDPREVQRLARVQERALRSWLYQRPADADSTVKPALERVAAEVEEAHGVPIEVVCVGDGPVGDGVRAQLRASREAMVNASKYADTTNISVFCEVEPEEVAVFVRDRGRGFDLDAVPDDRMGVRGSIIGRMERHGGSARIRTAPGEGTEVQLRMPLATRSE
ncbi:signal transduction histidine kinase/phage shock protein PspC (stress-responsive transcriptional regulator) [Lipingzhangella halophila]|uniref:Signal transduction histidine kinase/phage shock protein PspC (Stress-responsive transcriptional regulator) n=1 Tax=Lipingzhangella halophila TaxID=1783352 RepID=A0A7W7RL68_9ACTN|nr:ATP-binding protein [Lipingzhangella halophila]MBB4934010.1 signal transduction histidine kinase/phage shock protein PspC (stress-responsive transcriptional regulator) [Lipingzhangella halophila]